MSDESVTIAYPEEKNVYFTRQIDGFPALLTINESLVDFAYKEFFAWHLVVLIKYEGPLKDGIPVKKEEAKTVVELAKKLEQSIKSDFNGILLARKTSQGVRQLHFRVNDPKKMNDVLQRLTEKYGYVRYWEYSMSGDAPWQKAVEYFDLLQDYNKQKK